MSRYFKFFIVFWQDDLLPTWPETCVFSCILWWHYWTWNCKIFDFYISRQTFCRVTRIFA